MSNKNVINCDKFNYFVKLNAFRKKNDDQEKMPARLFASGAEDAAPRQDFQAEDRKNQPSVSIIEFVPRR